MDKYYLWQVGDDAKMLTEEQIKALIRPDLFETIKSVELTDEKAFVKYADLK